VKTASKLGYVYSNCIVFADNDFIPNKNPYDFGIKALYMLISSKWMSIFNEQ
jgi:hypothetical protein